MLVARSSIYLTLSPLLAVVPAWPAHCIPSMCKKIASLAIKETKDE
jgi:hypothetical protein